MLSECSSAKDVKCRRLKVGRETNPRRALAYPRPGSPHTRHSLRACAALRTYSACVHPVRKVCTRCVKGAKTSPLRSQDVSLA